MVHRHLHSGPLYLLSFHLTLVFYQALKIKIITWKTTGLACRYEPIRPTLEHCGVSDGSEEAAKPLVLIMNVTVR